MELLECADQVKERAPPAIEAPDDDGIDFAATGGPEQLLALRAGFRSRADFLFLDDDLPAAAFRVGSHRGELHRQGLLVVCGDPGVEPDLQRSYAWAHSGSGQKPVRNRYRKRPCF